MTNLTLNIYNNDNLINIILINEQDQIFKNLSYVLAKRLYNKKDNKINYSKDFKHQMITIKARCKIGVINNITTYYEYIFIGSFDDLESITNYI